MSDPPTHSKSQEANYATREFSAEIKDQLNIACILEDDSVFEDIVKLKTDTSAGPKKQRKIKISKHHTAEKDQLNGDHDVPTQGESEDNSEYLMTHPSPSIQKKKKKKEVSKKANRDPFKQALLELKKNKSPKKESVHVDYPSGSISSVDGYSTLVITTDTETEQSGTMIINEETKAEIAAIVEAHVDIPIPTPVVAIEEETEETKPLLSERVEEQKSVESTCCACIIL